MRARADLALGLLHLKDGRWQLVVAVAARGLLRLRLRGESHLLGDVAVRAGGTETSTRAKALDQLDKAAALCALARTLALEDIPGRGRGRGRE